MSEYIEKKAVADHLFECSRNEEIPMSIGFGFLAAADEVVAFPSADVVPVVRCRDCKRCFKKTTKRNKQTMLLCMRHDLNVCVRPNDFCSYGELNGTEAEV